MKIEDIKESIIAVVDDKLLPLMSNLSNATALFNKLENINWCGFYLVENDYLYLGPFQGDVACTKIEKSKGVCGTAFEFKKSIIVDDVNKFDGHIACSKDSKSEIVVPIIKDDKVVAVIDIDSPIYSRFNENDKKILEEIADYLKDFFI